MRKLFLASILTLLGFAAMAVTAQAQILSAPETTDSARVAISPYAQAVPNDSYTFIGISHPSLDSALTQIGLSLEVLDMTTVPNNAAGRSTTFTIDAGETHRIFVVNQSHSTINSLNSSFTDSRTHIITTVDSAQFGNVRVVSVNEAPTSATSVGGVRKYNNLSKLNMWGVVFISSSSTGFAMEFIGDAHDSSVSGAASGTNNGLQPNADSLFTGAGRGIN